MLLFTYGSLKTGQWLHEHYLMGAKYAGEYTTEPKYTMLNLGNYPGVVHNGTTSIMGEVWEIDAEALMNIDVAEGYPEFYDRELIDTEYGQAWMYFLSERYQDHYPEIKSGIWLGEAEDVF